ncbi:hypothetical protein SJAV_14890 [Sulfurisphaera javensis]|uniref:Uncharacterized protein n=1 Tax=Sulfurisphaera javensis TaxID=2049879 RepID=A0AAT9GRY6_9CREN
MSCDRISEALIYLWIGESKEAENISKECLQSLRDSISKIREKIKEIKANVEEEYILPFYLREKGIETEDLIKLALYELSRRINMFPGNSSSKNFDGVKYNVFYSGQKTIIRGYCKDCKGYKFEDIDRGFLIKLDGLIYGEILGSIKEDSEIKKLISELIK